MNEIETIEGEVVEELTQAVAVVASAPVNLFRTDDPNEVIKRASETATALADVLRKQKLTTEISGKEHVRVEGWTLLGSMLGVFPVCEWTRKLDNGWEARVVAQTLAGATVGAAEASCLRSEKTWAKRDDYALRSMAQTRATSKALRQPLGFVVSLAGFDPTPFEEMPREMGGKKQEVRVERARETITSWDELREAINGYSSDTWLDWIEFSKQASNYLFSKQPSELSAEQKNVFWQTSLQAAVYLREHVDPAKFPPPSRQDMRDAWADAMGVDEGADAMGVDEDLQLEGPTWRMDKSETDREPKS